MRVISLKPLREFWTEHPEAEEPLRYWYKTTKAASWKHFVEVRNTFRSADQYQHLAIFDIGGNKFRLIASLNYSRQMVYVRNVLTHNEYETGRWKVGLKR